MGANFATHGASSLDKSDTRRFALAKFTSPDLQQQARQILAHCKEQDFSGVAFGKTLVLYRAKEQRTLELLRNLALENVVPYLQRMSRGALARRPGNCTTS